MVYRVRQRDYVSTLFAVIVITRRADTVGSALLTALTTITLSLVTSDVKTAMDGTNWYTEYDNATTGTTQGMYYKNDGGIASQVSVSFMNEESFTPMLDDDLNPVTWTDLSIPTQTANRRYSKTLPCSF